MPMYQMWWITSRTYLHRFCAAYSIVEDQVFVVDRKILSHDEKIWKLKAKKKHVKLNVQRPTMGQRLMKSFHDYKFSIHTTHNLF